MSVEELTALLVETAPIATDTLGAGSPLAAAPLNDAGSSGSSGSSASGGRGDGAALLDAVVDYYERYLVATPAQLAALALWTLHTHCADAAESTPYLSISSAEKESGKTRVLEAAELVVAKPLATANISEAALFRSIEKDKPTLLFDEVDAIFGEKARDREDLRALLNSGHRRGKTVMRCVGDGGKQRVEEFEVFGPKALSGIGELPETIASRCIPIRMKRKSRDEQVDRFRVRDARTVAAPIKAFAAEWAEAAVDRLTDARPELPDELSDREQDGWEPLLAIADLAGGRWPERARDSAVELAGHRVETTSKGSELLQAIRDAFTKRGTDKLATSDLIADLAAADESPYSRWWNGDKPEPWAATTLARQLRPYDIKPGQVWIDGANARGYTAASFADAWNRWLSQKPLDPLGVLDTTNQAENQTLGQTLDTHEEALELARLEQIADELRLDGVL